MSAGRALIAGASGFVGGAAVERFSAQGWAVTGIARRTPAVQREGVAYRSIDLLDPVACRLGVDGLADVTHLVYAAVNETPGGLIAGWTDPHHAARNGAMFANLLDALVAAAPGLEHVGIVHGTKAYGKGSAQHVVIPWRESLPRPASDDFYFHQEDHVWRRAAQHGFGWTTYRAPMIAGGGRGSNLNTLLAIAVFACLCRAAGEPMPYPGATERTGITEMVDVGLLARAIEWGARSPNARNQAFNVANGDAYVWPDLWPIVAAEIGVDEGPPQPLSIAEAVAARAPLWAELVRRHALPVEEDPIAYLGESCVLADYVLGISGKASLTSTIKIRQAGFSDCIDTGTSIAAWIARWRAEGMLPPR